MNRKTVDRVLRAGVCLGISLCSAARSIAQIPADSPESLFAIARAYYGPDEARKTLPPGTPSGLTCLFKAAESNYPPALFNLYLAYGFGYLGEQDFQTAAGYRVRWLEALGTPSAYYQLAVGHLGVWIDVPDPKEKDFDLPNFMFTGDFADSNRGRLYARQSAFALHGFWGTTNIIKAVHYFSRSALAGVNRWSDLAATERGATEASIGMLTKFILGERVQVEFRTRAASGFRPKRVIELQEQVLPAETGPVAKVLLDAPRKGVKAPPNAMRAAARLLKRVSPEEFVSLVVEPSSPATAP